MNGQAIIEVLGEDQAGERIRLRTEGSCFLKNNRYFFSYSEEDEGNCVIKNTYSADRESLRVTKSGAVKTVMSFKEGMYSAGRYNTLYGELELGTKTLSYDFSDEGGDLRIKLEYELYLNGEFSGRRKLDIKVNMDFM